MNTDRFKFRVWDNHYKRYGLPPYIRRSREDYYIYAVETPQENPELIQHHFVLEQCTGLKDKNGKLIFEGDVVREHFKDGGSIDKLVFYNELQCKWYMRYNFQCSLGSAAFWEFGHHISHKLEIIGNVHEYERKENE